MSLMAVHSAPLEWRAEQGDLTLDRTAPAPAPSFSPSGRRPLYRRLAPLGPLGLVPPSRAPPRGFKQRQTRQDAGVASPLKATYPPPDPAPAAVTATAPTPPRDAPQDVPRDVRQDALQDVHVVAMSVSTSVTKGSEEAEQVDQDSPGSASVIHPVLLPPSSGPVHFQPEPSRAQGSAQGRDGHPRSHHQWDGPQPPQVYGMPEENYEVDEALSVLTNGRAHGKQPVQTPPPPPEPLEPLEPIPEEPEQRHQQLLLRQQQQQQQHQSSAIRAALTTQSTAALTAQVTPPTETPPPQPTDTPQAPSQPQAQPLQGQTQPQGQDGKPSGYVVEGRNYRKYRVEEKTPDGFIVGEYGVVSHSDGSLRGVRYTADSTINPRLIYDALVKFLSL